MSLFDIQEEVQKPKIDIDEVVKYLIEAKYFAVDL